MSEDQTTESSAEGYYWALDLPGLDMTGAEKLIECAEVNGLAPGGSTVDPKDSLTKHWDAASVDILHRVLSAAMTALTFSDEDNDAMASIVEDLADWMAVRSRLPG